VETVLHVAQPRVGGVPAVVAAFVAHQARSGRRVVVASSAKGPLPERVRAAGAEHVAWEATRAPGPRTAAETLSLRRIVRDVAPDLVHLHSAKAGLAGRLAVRGSLPTVFQPHMWSFQAATGPVHVGAVLWERWATRWSDVIVCVSDAERALGEGKGVRARVEVVPNGVDLRRFAPQERAAARARLGLDAGPLALCVGRITEEKGQDLLVGVWDRVRARVDGAALALVGSGPAEDALRAQAGTGVVLAGHRDDVPDWLAAADVVVVPSRWEGMSLVMLEAMAAGRPVVSTDVPGAREALRDGGGAVVPIDAAALADAIAQRLSDPALAGAEGRAARAAAERSHDVEDLVRRIDELYTLVLSSRSGPPP
jgi:glycosyltransferase involved in cell wall biosynthesis